MSDRAAAFMWKGRPVYRCRWCKSRFERVDNLPAVLEHEKTMHAPEPPAERPSRILGLDGQPLLIVEGGA